MVLANSQHSFSVVLRYFQVYYLGPRGRTPYPCFVRHTRNTVCTHDINSLIVVLDGLLPLLLWRFVDCDEQCAYGGLPRDGHYRLSTKHSRVGCHCVNSSPMLIEHVVEIFASWLRKASFFQFMTSSLLLWLCF